MRRVTDSAAVGAVCDRTRRLILVGVLLLTPAMAWGDKVTSDYDHAVTFSKYSTFMWIDRPQSDQPFMDDRIMAAVNAQLRLKGLRLVHEGADLAVAANLATEEKHTWETYYVDSGYGWGSGWATTEERIYQVGTLTVDLFDVETKRLVWEGIATDTLSRKPEHRSKDYRKSIAKMFKDFPPSNHRESELQTPRPAPHAAIGPALPCSACENVQLRAPAAFGVRRG